MNPIHQTCLSFGMRKKSIQECLYSYAKDHSSYCPKPISSGWPDSKCSSAATHWVSQEQNQLSQPGELKYKANTAEELHVQNVPILL